MLSLLTYGSLSRRPFVPAVFRDSDFYFNSLKTLAADGLEELFFQLCRWVSFWFWQEVGFGFTYLCT